MIRVYVVDDHPAIIEGLESSFSYANSDIQMIGSSTSISQTIIDLATNKIDVLILDLYLHPDEHSIRNVDVIRKLYPTLPIVIYTAETSRTVQISTYKHGANAYVCKDGYPYELPNIIKHVYTGQTWLSNGITIQEIIEEPPVYCCDNIPEKELLIVQLLSKGLRSYEIAEKIRWKVQTVNNKITMMHKKYGTKSQAHLVALFISLGLIPAPHIEKEPNPRTDLNS